MHRSGASHHPEDGDPRLHAPPHSGDAGELGRPGERRCGQPAQRSAAGQLQPQPVAQLCPKQSSHTITIVAKTASSAVFLFFVSFSFFTGLLFSVLHDALRSVFSESRGTGRGRAAGALTAERRRPARPTSSAEARPLTCVPSLWSTVLTQRRGLEAGRGGRTPPRDHHMVNTADDSSCSPPALLAPPLVTSLQKTLAKMNLASKVETRFKRKGKAGNGAPWSEHTNRDDAY